jgi:predicted RNA methylase
MGDLAASPATAATSGDWERMWAPYDETIYGQVLAWLDPDDVVLDIGAGDLRLARRMADRVNHVYAIELNRGLGAMAPSARNAGNLTLIWADAYQVPFSSNITVAVLLMRHCQGFSQLLSKLRYVGCRRLITNARWRAGVELIDLRAQPISYQSAGLGWYACRCGSTGFVQGPVEQLTPQIESAVQEVSNCPACS